MSEFTVLPTAIDPAASPEMGQASFGRARDVLVCGVLAGVMLTGCSAFEGADSSDPSGPSPVPSGPLATPGSGEGVIPGTTDADRACNLLLAQDSGKLVQPGDIFSAVQDPVLVSSTLNAFYTEVASSVTLKADNKPEAAAAGWLTMPQGPLKVEAGEGIADAVLADVALYATSPSRASDVAAKARATFSVMFGTGTSETQAAYARVDQLLQQGQQVSDALHGDAHTWSELSRAQTRTWSDLNAAALKKWSDLNRRATTARAEVCATSGEFKENVAEAEAELAAYDKECETLPDADRCEADRAIEAAHDGYAATSEKWAARVDPRNTEQQRRIDEAEADAAIEMLEAGYPGLADNWDERIIDPAQRERVDEAQATLAIEYADQSYLTLSFNMAGEVASPAARARIDVAYNRIALDLGRSGYLALANSVSSKISDPELRNETQLLLTGIQLY